MMARVLGAPPANPGLIKAFLKAGVLNGDDITRYRDTGTPQGGIALPALDDHVVGVQEAVGRTHDQRMRRRRKGLADYRLVRYADDFVVLVAGTRAQAEAVQEETAAVLRPMGLRLSPLKTGVCHIDEGFDSLGFRIQRHRKPHVRRPADGPCKWVPRSCAGRLRSRAEHEEGFGDDL